MPARWGIEEVFETREDLQLPSVKGTLWGAYNAITRFEDYKQPQQEEQPDQRLERTWFGGGGHETESTDQSERIGQLVGLNE